MHVAISFSGIKLNGLHKVLLCFGFLTLNQANKYIFKGKDFLIKRKIQFQIL